MSDVILRLCYPITGIIELYIMFQFMDARYRRVYQNKSVYTAIWVALSILLTGINLLERADLNFVSWVIVIGVCAKVLYFDSGTRDIRIVLECEAVLFVIAFAETLFVMTVGWIVKKLQIESILVRGFETMFFTIFLVLCGFPIIRRMGNAKAVKSDKAQPVLLGIMLVYFFFSIVEMGTIIISDGVDDILVFFNMGLTVFIIIFLIYYIKNADDKRQHEEEMAMLKQQAQLQYEYYRQQEQKYNETIRILHDVNKHIRTLGGLYMAENEEEAKKYAEQIRAALNPLIPAKYTGNAILDILLSDKFREAKSKGIELEIRLEGVSFDFMEAIDITTIFGNLLDNAIEACETLQTGKEKQIFLTARKINEMVSFTLENDSGPVLWKGNIPISEKKGNRGIGLLNVRKCIDKYDGDIKFREEKGRFVTEFFINITGIG